MTTPKLHRMPPSRQRSLAVRKRPSYHALRVAPLALVLCCALLAGCSLGGSGGSASAKTITMATVLPITGLDGSVGQAMQNAVDLAVQQNSTLAGNYTLTVAHVDSTANDPAAIASTLAGNTSVMGIVGPLDSQTAAGMLPGIQQAGVVTISPGASLPGLTQASAATAEGLSFTQLHPQGTAEAFFRLTQTDSAIGKAAADLAVAAQQSHGFAARNVFVVDDGSPSGKAQAAAFSSELGVQHGSVAGHSSITTSAQSNAQSIVSAIVEANPDIVFYAGDITGGALLRGTLSLSGAPGVPILAAGYIADDPGWGAAVGVAAASANTTDLLPAQDLSTLSKAKTFLSSYQNAYPNQAVVPESALAYDAAMDEITAIKGLLAAGKPVTRAAVLAAVAGAKYAGITGTLAFNTNGDDTTPPSFGVYTCDTKGNWTYQGNFGG